LTRHPALPRLPRWYQARHRSARQSQIRVNGRKSNFVNTHVSAAALSCPAMVLDPSREERSCWRKHWPKRAAQWAKQICASAQRTVDSILETGRLLIAAKALDHGEFESMIANDLPFDVSTARRQMKMTLEFVPMGTFCRRHGERSTNWRCSGWYV
jgi:citrate lyase beta subunit